MNTKVETEENKGEEKPEGVVRLYRDRLKLLKKGQEYSQSDDIPKAVECYNQYLGALASFFGVEEAKLRPNLFDKEKDLAEMLLISHVYWDLAKAYDRSPNLHVQSVRCLDQFAKFTIGFKYQYVNARMLKNFIRKRLAHNPKAFKQTYERIQVEGKGCFIATDIYGYNAIETNRFRELKPKILNIPGGFYLIEFYYQNLCPFYFKFDHNGGNFLRPLFKSAFALFYRIIKK